jgi:hypothetical protein
LTQALQARFVTNRWDTKNSYSGGRAAAAT